MFIIFECHFHLVKPKNQDLKIIKKPPLDRGGKNYFEKLES